MQKWFPNHIKMSDFGIEYKELTDYTANAIDTMAGLFKMDPSPMTVEEIIEILEKSYK